MQKCMKCGTEYEDGIASCPVCDLDYSKRAETIDESLSHEGKEALLTTVNDNFEASLIEARLKQEGIPVLLKYKGTGAYLSLFMGKTSFGVEIYVPSDLIDKAREIMVFEMKEGMNDGEDSLEDEQNIPEDEQDSQDDEQDSPEDEQDSPLEFLNEAENDYQKNIEFRSWLIFGVIVLVVVVAAILSFLK